MTGIRPPDRLASARLLTVVSALYLLFVFYGSWVPLHFVRLPLADALNQFSALPFLDQRIESATDWATNFLLLIPLSFLWAQRFLPDQRGFASVFTRIFLVTLGIGLAFALEFSQLYFPPRTVSQKDILALSLGVIAGSAAQFRWGAVVEDWLSMLWQHESHRVRVIRLLHVYLLVLFVFNMLPLDLTLSLVELYHKWREGRVILIPFEGIKGGLFTSLYSIATDILVWMPVGIFLALERKSSLLRVAVTGLLLSAAIEVAQLFVYSRVSDTTDILLAGIGSVAGGILVNKGRNLVGSLRDVRAGFWSLLWLAWILVVLGVFWFPYDFDLSAATPGTAWAALTRLPFLMLYQNTEFRAVNELLRKIGFFLPVGVLWALRNRSMGKEFFRTNRRFGEFLVIASLPLIVEGGQLFLPGKYADLTDALLEACGALLGIVLVRWVLDGHHRPGATGLKPELDVRPTNNREVATAARMLPHSPRFYHVLTFLGLTIAVGVVTRLPALPYNVRELNAPGIAGLLTTLGLALAIYWIANGHFIFLEWAGQARLLSLPFWLLVHGAIAWLILRSMVPIESIQDIIGTPVLDWPWEWESIGRYLALHGAISVQAVGAILLMRVVCRRGPIAALMIWGMCAALLAWPLHLVVVDYAATDNLTELMRDGGGFVTSVVLAAGLFALFLSGVSIAACIAFPGARGKALALIIVSSLAATAAFWFGSEQLIMKYGKVFSASQFLLSTDRQHYAHGSGLLLRYLVAYTATVCLLGAIQFSHVQSFARNTVFRSRFLSPT